MKSRVRLWRWVASVISVSILLLGSTARSQVAPIGAHHTSVGGGTGQVSPVSPTGGYNATVPISLPAPRGGLSLPFELRYTGTGHAGAAGIGWDIPLWYVRRSGGPNHPDEPDETRWRLWHRKPAVNSNEAGRDVAPERLFLSMGGGAQRMVPGPEAGLYLPYVADEYMELREEGTAPSSTFTLSTARGVDYRFENSVVDPTLWLLTEVRDRVGTERISLSYEGGLLLGDLTYTYDDDEEGTALYFVDLEYEHWTVPDVHSGVLEGILLDIGQVGWKAWVIGQITSDAVEINRSRTLKRVIVNARNNLDGASSPLRAIRTYHLSYQPDEDTTAPRLSRVDLAGEEMNLPTMPIARYEYGSITKRRVDAQGNPLNVYEVGEVGFGPPVAVPRDAAAVAAGATWVAGSFASGVTGDTYQDTIQSTHVIRDFTGDGVPDLVYQEAGIPLPTWHLVKGTVTDAGVSLAGGATTSWTEPPDIHVQRMLYSPDIEFSREARRRMTTTETLVTFTDFNGDGRLDIIDARTEDPGYWHVYINREGPNGLPEWLAPFRFGVADLVAHLETAGVEYDPHDLDNRSTPIERTRSWQKQWEDRCWEDDGDEVRQPGEPSCLLFPPVVQRGQTDTIAEWVLNDVNGDAFPDIVANTRPVRECENSEYEPTPSCNSFTGVYQCYQSRHDYIQMGWCPEEDVEEPPGENGAVAFLNQVGVFHEAGERNYDPPYWDEARSGVLRWTTGNGNDGPLDLDLAFIPPWRSAGFVDVHGIGRPSYSRTSLASDDEPTGYEHFDSGRHHCGYSPGTPVVTNQTRGLVDLSGDGVPDLIYRDEDNYPYWFVRFGTTAGFGPPREIHSTLPFAISESTGHCFGVAKTSAGLVDLDGDGKPELVRVQGDTLYAASIETTMGVVGGLDPGRLTAIENGYGARTEIRYANNKAESATPHQVAVPEIVVAETQVRVEDGSAPDSVLTRYAYGTVDARFDPDADHRVFTGYRRMVTLVGGSNDRTGADLVEGYATIVDRRAPAPYGLHGASYSELVLGGRIEETHRLEGIFDPDPRALLPLTAPYPQARAHRSFSYEVTELEVGALPADGIGLAECMDINDVGEYTFGEWLCHHAGIVRPSTVFEWEGIEAPSQGVRNVARASAVSEVDERGRPMEIVEYGDMRTFADDRCITIEYAGGPASPLSAVAGIWTTDCGWINATMTGLGVWTPGTPILLAGQRFLYDDLPHGSISRGQLTSRIVENYDTSDGSFLGEHVAVTLAYDELGNVERAVAAREMGTAATRTTSFEYDTFGASVMRTTESATDVAQVFVETTEMSTWPTEKIVATDLNGVATTTTRDAFGRPITTRVTAPGFDHLVGEVAYDDEGREVTATTYPAATGVAQRTHVHLDALGRVRFRQIELGADYAQSTLVTDLVEFDSYGRAVYQAAAFEWAELPFSPDSLPGDPTAWPFGISVAYDPGGRPVRSVEAPGKRPDETTTNVGADIFVSDVEQVWEGGQLITRTQGPNENSPGEPSFGVRDETIATALGWEVESARVDAAGTRIDRVRRGFDRFGNEAIVQRYKDPAGPSLDVTWLRRFDSLGQLLCLTEPGTAPINHVYDEWGGLLESSWLASGVLKTSRFEYDGLGRQTVSEVVSTSGGVETVETRELSHYDTHSGSPHQPAGDLRGRLSRIETVGVGDAYFGYDVIGRNASETYLMSGHGQPMRTSRTFEPGGSMRELRFDTPVGSPNIDRLEYRHDSAMRTSSITDLGTGVALFRGVELDAETGYEEILLGNGVREVFQFAPGGRRELEHWGVTTNSGQRDQYPMARDAEGRLRQESINHFGSPYLVQHEYDALDRLVRSYSTGGGQPQDERFEYSPLGNLTKKLNLLQANQERNYSYSDTVDPDRLCRFYAPGQNGGCNSTYDGAGNLVNDAWGTSGTSGNRTFTYDAASRVREIVRGSWRASFLYGPGGELARTEVWNGSQLHRQIWSFGGLIEERLRPDRRTQIERRVPGPLGIVATLRTEGGTRETIYVHGDGRGNRFFTGSDGRIKQELRYRAFGSVILDNGDPSAITYTDDLWNGGDDLRELGVVILGARVFDPVLGRFVQRDPISFSGSSSNGNPYAFAFNDPVNYGDPSGLSPGCVELECFEIAIAETIVDFFGGVAVGAEVYERHNPEQIAFVAGFVGSAWATFDAVTTTSCQVMQGRSALDCRVEQLQNAGETVVAMPGLARAFANDPSGTAKAVFCDGLGKGNCLAGVYNFAGGMAAGLLTPWPDELFTAANGIRQVSAVGRSAVGAVDNVVDAATVAARTPAGEVALDTNAVIASIEHGQGARILAGRSPVVSMTAAKEFLRGSAASADDLRAFLAAAGGRIGAPAQEATVAAMMQAATAAGRRLRVDDARVAASAMRDSLTLITNDVRFANFLRAIGYPVEGF